MVLRSWTMMQWKQSYRNPLNSKFTRSTTVSCVTDDHHCLKKNLNCIEIAPINEQLLELHMTSHSISPYYEEGQNRAMIFNSFMTKKLIKWRSCRRDPSLLYNSFQKYAHSLLRQLIINLFTSNVVIIQFSLVSE